MFQSPSRRLTALATNMLATLTFATGLDLARADAAPARAAACADDVSAAGLNSFFASGRAPVQADYQRVLALPDGRSLWTFQDAFVKLPSGRAELIHNAALVQTGRCFQLLRGGTADHPRPWLFADVTEPYRHWFWPLAAAIASDGSIRIFVAEMRLRGEHYLADRTEPVATWMTTVRATDLEVVDVRLAPDPSASLYGWSITSDRQWTYLYAHCYRQFGFQQPFGHDFSCTADVRVGRVARGQLDDRPTYWDGTRWQADPGRVVPVIPRQGRAVNATQVRWDGRRFVAVTKEGDWWGDTIYVDVAPSAEGPWRTVRAAKVASACAGCNTYFASFVSTGHTTKGLVIAISNNRWDGSLSKFYNPTFLTLRFEPNPPRLEAARKLG